LSKQGSGQIDEAIESISELEQRAEDDVSGHQRWIERVTWRIGQPRMVYFIGTFVVVWIAVNGTLYLTHHGTLDPPPFFGLQGMVSLTALLMTVLILTTENRLSQIAIRRNRLDLQINLLTERKVAKLIDMLDTMRRDLPSIPTHHDPEVDVLREHLHPVQIVEAMEAPTPASGTEE